MKIQHLFAAGLLALTAATVHADTFGSGANAFTIDFLTIGNPGNPVDTGTTGSYFSSYGAVSSIFQVGKYEVSEDMITKANTLGGLLITKDTRGVDKPATGVSWNEAARFVNWLNTSQGFTAAYKFTLQPGDGGYTGNEDLVLWTMSDAGYDAGICIATRTRITSCRARTSGIRRHFTAGAGRRITPTRQGATRFQWRWRAGRVREQRFTMDRRVQRTSRKLAD